MENLEQRSLISTDQMLADFLSHLETHAWNRARRAKGYDLIFVDEFHLFSPLERQVIHYLTRDVSNYPRIFMAVDPRQSPAEAFIGVASSQIETHSQSGHQSPNDSVENFDLSTVHRYTPEILKFVKHIHHDFPTLDLGSEWSVDITTAMSNQKSGSVPIVTRSGTRAAEETDIYRTVVELYPNHRLAIAVVDTTQWERFSALGALINQSKKYNVAIIAGRSDVEGVGYRKRGVVVGPAEYLAGLQFEAVLVVGLPNHSASLTVANERNRVLSLLYLAVSRAQQIVRVFVNDDDGGLPDVLERAILNGCLQSIKGAEA